MDAGDLIRQLDLQPHPEGGWFRETYRSSQTVQTPAGERAAATAILYLLADDAFSAFHRVRSDEVFHFYRGDPATLVQFDGSGCRSLTLGPDASAGQHSQALVPGGVWQAVYLPAGSQWALMGCTVAPGFEFDDFELTGRADLIQRFPQHAALIEKLTRE